MTQHFKRCSWLPSKNPRNLQAPHPKDCPAIQGRALHWNRVKLQSASYKTCCGTTIVDVHELCEGIPLLPAHNVRSFCSLRNFQQPANKSGSPRMCPPNGQNQPRSKTRVVEFGVFFKVPVWDPSMLQCRSFQRLLAHARNVGSQAASCKNHGSSHQIVGVEASYAHSLCRRNFSGDSEGGSKPPDASDQRISAQGSFARLKKAVTAVPRPIIHRFSPRRPKTRSENIFGVFSEGGLLDRCKFSFT